MNKPETDQHASQQSITTSWAHEITCWTPGIQECPGKKDLGALFRGLASRCKIIQLRSRITRRNAIDSDRTTLKTEFMIEGDGVGIRGGFRRVVGNKVVRAHVGSSLHGV